MYHWYFTNEKYLLKIYYKILLIYQIKTKTKDKSINKDGETINLIHVAVIFVE